MGCAFGRLAGARQRVGAGDVEIAQDHVAEPVRGPGIAQHDLGHQLRPAVGRHRHQPIVLADRRMFRLAVNRRRRGKHEMVDAALHGAFDHRARIHRVVAIVAQRLRHRLRNHDRGGEVNDRVDPVPRDQRGDQRLIAGIADHELGGLRHRPFESGRQVVEHHDRFARVDERMHHVAADIARAPRDQNAHLSVVSATQANGGSRRDKTMAGVYQHPAARSKTRCST